jgi:hypothetical protein
MDVLTFNSFATLTRPPHAAALFDCFKSAQTHAHFVVRIRNRTNGMKTIDSLIDFFDRVATPRMTDTQIEIIEKKLLNLAEVDGEAARHYADLYRSRLNWERTRSPEQRLNFVDQARNAQAWLAGNSL